MSKIDTVSDAIKRIGKRSERENAFSMLYGHGRYGWEKWLQVELALQLSDWGDPSFEVPHPYDQRRKTAIRNANFENAFIDIEFREKGDLKHWKTAIEIKLHESEQGLRNVLSDLIRISALRGNDWRFRSVIAVFGHGTKAQENVTRYSKFKRIKDGLQSSSIANNIFPVGSFEFMVFGWEEKLQSNMSVENYRAWLESVKSVFNESV